MTQGWPWPRDPEECRERAQEIIALKIGAMREIGGVDYMARVNLFPTVNMAQSMQAQRLAFVTLRIEYENIPEPEYIERRVALGKPPMHGGPEYGLNWTEGWWTNPEPKKLIVPGR